MKQFFTFLGIVAMGATAYGQADTDIVNIPDANFKNRLLNNHKIDTNKDGEISYGEARAYTGSIYVSNRNIESLEGIEAFINITQLECSNNQLTSLDVSKNIELQKLKIDKNQLRYLDVSNNVALTDLDCNNNLLTNLNTNGASKLRFLRCYNNQLTILDVSNNGELRILECKDNPLETLDISNTYVVFPESLSYNQATLKHFKMRNHKVFIESFLYTGHNLETLDVSGSQIRYLSCHNNKLKHLDVRGVLVLQQLYCKNNQLTNLDVSQNTRLRTLNCSNNKISNLDVSNNAELTLLYCDNNQLTNLDVSGAIKLAQLECNNNQLTNLNLNNNLELRHLECSNNQLTNLETGSCEKLQFLDCSGNQLNNLDINKNQKLEILRCSNNNLVVLDIKRNKTIRELLCANNPQLSQLFLNGAIGNNIYVKKLDATNNPSLFCIDRGSYHTLVFNEWKKDSHTSYSDNCNYPTLSTTEVKAENLLQILNPVKDNLVIKTTAKIERVEIYNTAGQLVKVLFKGNTQVQDLAKGIYLLKITTDQGVITEKIVK